MPQQGEPPVLTQLAEEFLGAVRAAARALSTTKLPDETIGGTQLVTNVSATAFRLMAAASSSPDLAKAIQASPELAALSIASPKLAQLAHENPAIAEMAIVSPNLAMAALKAPELMELARSSPSLAAMIEAQLAQLKDQSAV